MSRPHVLLSVATSLDGHIDDAGPERLILSGAEDLDRVDAERAAVDAILVGAATIAADDPRLLVRSAARRAERVARGLPPSPIKVAITRTGRGLDPSAKFFTAGDGEKLVYALVDAPSVTPAPAAAPVASAVPPVAPAAASATPAAAPPAPAAAPSAPAAVPAAPAAVPAAPAAVPIAPAAVPVAPAAAPPAPAAAPSALAAALVAPAPAPTVPDLQRRLAGLATVVTAPDLPSVLADLAARGVARLMVEGGTRTTTAFLTAGLVDELQVVVAPLVVGDPAAPRLAAAAVDRMELVDLRRVGDCALLVYRPRLP